ncbi:hypothetical protein FJT64_011571 [Amphibalanus amphitrite]|uniref:Uncharacterized protein n=1 Tax=Amphibalanus amphitrite TaxID=1232801 RepID=A0A6A4V1V3_AMPAM|nr:hypothetical protein FJT64_011571 [Amphibalanus amphitrite]
MLVSAMSRYRRPRHHTYDYNYKVGESSYQDMLAYLDRKQGLRSASPPPGRKSFAERFVEKPIYGDVGALALGSAAGRPLAGGSVDGETRAALADADLEAEEFIAALKRRPRAQANGPSALAGEPGEDLGTRTRRALQKIDADFEAMGLFDRAPAASAALAVREDGEEAALSSAKPTVTDTRPRLQRAAMSASLYPALGRRNNLLRSLRAEAAVDRSFYDPAVDRQTLYSLPQRARFWPGSDTLYGDEWQYWYGDIAIPEELSRPRRRPSCLDDEQGLNERLLRKMRSDKGEFSSGAAQRRSSASRIESVADAAESSMEHLARARSLRASSVSRLQATRDSMERDARAIRASSLSRRAVTPSFSEDPYADIDIPEELTRPRRRPVSLQRESDALVSAEEASAASRASKYLRSVRSVSVQKMSSSEQQTSSQEIRSSSRGRSALRSSAAAAADSEYLGLDGNKVYVPPWLENHPIPDPPQRRAPPAGAIWPEKRPFYDLKNDYDAMLSYMGVTKELKKAVGAA